MRRVACLLVVVGVCVGSQCQTEEPVGLGVPEERDFDGDGTPELQDNCPDNANPDQRDSDGDGLGDVCDACPLDPQNDIDVGGDVLGNAYEYLIAQFADDAGKKGGEFYTPKMVVRLIVECLRPQEGMNIYDPTCGSGGMLLESVHYLERHGKNPKALTLYGQEMNAGSTSIAPPRPAASDRPVIC